MEVVEIKRSFKYNGIALADPNPSLGPDQVREFYGSQYPELNNAVVEGPVTKAGVATYTFARAAGAKGAHQPVAATGASAREVLASALSEQGADATHATMQLARGNESMMTAARNLHSVVVSNRPAAPMALPGSAYGFWG